MRYANILWKNFRNNNYFLDMKSNEIGCCRRDKERGDAVGISPV